MNAFVSAKLWAAATQQLFTPQTAKSGELENFAMSENFSTNIRIGMLHVNFNSDKSVTQLQENMKTPTWVIGILGALLFASSCHRTDCSNGLEDPGEAGVDCGGSCPDCPFPSDSLTKTGKRLLGNWKLRSIEILYPYYGTLYSDSINCRIEFKDNSSRSFPGPGYHGCINGLACSIDSNAFWICLGDGLTINQTQYKIEMLDSFDLTLTQLYHSPETRFTLRR